MAVQPAHIIDLKQCRGTFDAYFPAEREDEDWSEKEREKERERERQGERGGGIRSDESIK